MKNIMLDHITDHRMNENDDRPIQAPPNPLTGPGDLVRLIDYARQMRDERRGDSSQTAVMVTIWTDTGNWLIAASWPNVSVSSFEHNPSVSFTVKSGQNTRQVFEELREYGPLSKESELRKAGLIYDNSDNIF